MENAARSRCVGAAGWMLGWGRGLQVPRESAGGGGREAIEWSGARRAAAFEREAFQTSDDLVLIGIHGRDRDGEQRPQAGHGRERALAVARSRVRTAAGRHARHGGPVFGALPGRAQGLRARRRHGARPERGGAVMVVAAVRGVARARGSGLDARVGAEGRGMNCRGRRHAVGIRCRRARHDEGRQAQRHCHDQANRLHACWVSPAAGGRARSHTRPAAPERSRPAMHSDSKHRLEDGAKGFGAHQVPVNCCAVPCAPVPRVTRERAAPAGPAR